MIETPYSLVIGAGSRPGISTGNEIYVGIRAGGAVQPAKPKPIDLTAETLDRRITYTGPGHFYYAESGLLAMSQDNVWPLEYANGAPVGRHEPEPAATNLQPGNRVLALSDFVKASGVTEITVDETGAPDGGAIGRIPVDASSYMVSQDVGGAQIVPLADYDLTDAWQRLAFPATVTSSSHVRLWLGRNTHDANGNPSVWLTQNTNLSPGDYVFSWFAKASDDGVTFPAGLGQIERVNYPHATSPIVTDTASASRAASSVTVAKDGNATGIRIHFSDGSTQALTFTVDSISIPLAGKNWGERYITRIEYEA